LLPSLHTPPIPVVYWRPIILTNDDFGLEMLSALMLNKSVATLLCHKDNRYTIETLLQILAY